MNSAKIEPLSCRKKSQKLIVVHKKIESYFYRHNKKTNCRENAPTQIHIAITLVNCKKTNKKEPISESTTRNFLVCAKPNLIDGQHRARADARKKKPRDQ